MAMEVDGSKLLAAIASDPAAFSFSRSQVNGIALDALVGKLKDKDTKLATIQAICSTVGSEDLSIVVGALKPKELESLNRRLDAKNPDIKTTDGAWHRAHLLDLAKGTAEAFMPEAPVKPGRAPRAPAPPVPKIGKILGSEAQKSGGRRKVARPPITKGR